MFRFRFRVEDFVTFNYFGSPSHTKSGRIISDTSSSVLKLQSINFSNENWLYCMQSVQI